MMFLFTRNARYTVAVLALAVLTACDDHSVSSPASPRSSSASQGPSSRAALEAQINGLINDLYAPRDQGAVYKQFADIKSDIASGRSADAETKLIAFFNRLLTDSKNGILQDPNGAQPPTTADALRTLLGNIASFAGVSSPIPPPAADGAIGVIGPAGGTLVSSSGFGGVSIPPGALPSDAIVVINRLPNPTAPKTGPLPTTLDQYPLFYDFSTIPVIPQFNDFVLVGVCQLEVGEPFAPATQAIADRLQLAHPNPLNPSTIELLPRADASFMHCDGVNLASAASKTAPVGLAARFLDAATTVGTRVAALFMPTPAYAVHGGLGGLTKSFSPFAGVDPGQSIVGVCSSPMAGVSSTFATIPAAIAAVNVGGVIRLCPQTINVASTITVSKPVTIEASVPATPPQIVISGTGLTGFVVAPNVQSSVTFRGIDFTLTGGASSAIDLGTGQAPNFPPGSWWEVTIENNTFTMPNGVGRAVRAFHTVYAHPKLTFQLNQTVGGTFPVVTLTGSSTSDIEVLSNSFGAGTSVNAVLLQNEASANVSNNIFGACTVGGSCVRLDNVAAGVVSNNTMSVPSSTSTGAGIVARGGNTTIASNIILGGGIVGAATDTASYRFKSAAILLQAPSLVADFFDASGTTTATADVSMNTITNAATGIRILGGGISVTGSNNDISRVHSVVRVDNTSTTPSSLINHTNDFANFVTAIRFNWPSAPGTINVQCSWWGTAAGPSAFAVGVPVSMYSPFATAPVANGGTGLCNGT